MSPVDPSEPRTRRLAWRIMTTAGVLLASVAILLSVILFAQVQRSREENVRNACVGQNERHDDAVNFFLTSPLFQPKTKLTPAQEKVRVKTIEAFVQTLLPHENCAERVRRQVR